MALFGSITTLEKQSCPNKFSKVFHFLNTTDIASVFAQMTCGDKKTIEIDGNNIFAIFQIYMSKLPENAKLEGHRTYIDLQYIFEGSEIIAYSDLKNITEEPIYDPQKDIFFCNTNQISNIILSTGEAAILFPDDLHAPSICIDKPSLVKKIVFKVKC